MRELVGAEREAHEQYLASEQNGIWLCADCADEVDRDVDSYPVSRLQSLKNDAVKRAAEWYSAPRGISGVVDLRSEIETLGKFKQWLAKDVERLQAGRTPKMFNSAMSSLSTDEIYGLRIRLNALRNLWPANLRCLTEDGLQRQERVLGYMEQMVQVLGGPLNAYESGMRQVLEAYADLDLASRGTSR